MSQEVMYDDDGIPIDPDVANFDEYITLQSQLNELGRIQRIAAQVELDIQDKGALYRYIEERRFEAVAAMRDLIRHDAQDSHGIAALQSKVVTWLDACDWINAKLDESDQTDALIKEEKENNAGQFEDSDD